MDAKKLPPKKPVARAASEATTPVANLTTRVHTVPAFECAKCGHLTVNAKRNGKTKTTKCSACQHTKLIEMVLIGRRVAA